METIIQNVINVGFLVFILLMIVWVIRDIRTSDPYSKKAEPAPPTHPYDLELSKAVKDKPLILDALQQLHDKYQNEKVCVLVQGLRCTFIYERFANSDMVLGSCIDHKNFIDDVERTVYASEIYDVLDWRRISRIGIFNGHWLYNVMPGYTLKLHIVDGDKVELEKSFEEKMKEVVSHD